VSCRQRARHRQLLQAGIAPSNRPARRHRESGGVRPETCSRCRPRRKSHHRPSSIELQWKPCDRPIPIRRPSPAAVGRLRRQDEPDVDPKNITVAAISAIGGAAIRAAVGVDVSGLSEGVAQRRFGHRRTAQRVRYIGPKRPRSGHGGAPRERMRFENRPIEWWGAGWQRGTAQVDVIVAGPPEIVPLYALTKSCPSPTSPRSRASTSKSSSTAPPPSASRCPVSAKPSCKPPIRQRKVVAPSRPRFSTGRSNEREIGAQRCFGVASRFAKTFRD